MAIYFNTIIPIKIFLEIAEEVMQKYDVKLYVEKNSANECMMKRYYVKNNISESDFFDEEYSCFFFSTKDVDLTEKEMILESGKVICNNWFSFYDEMLFSIEGTGGRENNNDIEMIKLRQIAKEPDKQIKAFYNMLQMRLRKIENIRLYKNKSLRIYYMETGKRMWSYLEKQIPSTIDIQHLLKMDGT